MTRRVRGRIALGGLAVAAALASVAAVAQPAASIYPIRLSRTPALGSRVRWEVVARERIVKTMRASNRPESSETHTRIATLRAVRTVRRLETRGRCDRGEVVIERLTIADDGGQERTALPVGTVLDITFARTAAAAIVRVGGRDATPTEREDIGRVITLSQDSVTDDDVFGSTRSQRIGSSWPIASALAAQSMAGRGFVVSAAGVRGRTSLVGVRPCHGTATCLDLKSDITFRNARPASLPPGARVTASVMTAQVRGLFPTDAALPTTDSVMRLVGELRAVVQPQPGVDVEVGIEMETERRETAAPVP